jgi:hypothetical protein
MTNQILELFVNPIIRGAGIACCVTGLVVATLLWGKVNVFEYFYVNFPSLDIAGRFLKIIKVIYAVMEKKTGSGVGFSKNKQTVYFVEHITVIYFIVGSALAVSFQPVMYWLLNLLNFKIK